MRRPSTSTVVSLLALLISALSFILAFSSYQYLKAAGSAEAVQGAVLITLRSITLAEKLNAQLDVCVSVHESNAQRIDNFSQTSSEIDNIRERNLRILDKLITLSEANGAANPIGIMQIQNEMHTINRELQSYLSYYEDTCANSSEPDA